MNRYLLLLAILLFSELNKAQNPIVTNIFTADPAAMVYHDTVFLYTGHDEATSTGAFYVMNDWQCFTSTDMKNWTSVGKVFSVSDVSWAKGDAWASEVEERSGKFYYYFCAEHKTITGKAIGVAVSDSPYGPFTDKGTPLITNKMTTTISSTWDDIDPTVFIDNDGQAYLYWGNSQCYYVKLKENMIETEGDIVPVKLPGYTEAPFLHKRDSTFYLSYAYGWPEKIAYATSSSISGPWQFQGILNDYVGNCGTNHQSIINFKNHWYFVYHTGDIGGDYQRSVAIDYLFYNADNSMAEVVQTRYGVARIETTLKCPPLQLKPIVSINQGAATQMRNITVDVGDNVSFSPRARAKGTWKWEGPDSFASNDSVVSLTNITHKMSGIYLATFTNSCGTKSYLSFTNQVNYKFPKNLVSGKIYQIEPMNSGKVITIAGQEKENGSNVLQAENEGLPSQQFVLTLVDSIFWKITPLHVPAKALDVFNISTKDGAKVCLWEYWGGKGQQWQIGESGNGSYIFISRNSQKCLHVNPADNNLMQWTCNGAENQQFNLKEVNDDVNGNRK